MEARALLDALHVAERLKDETRHCYTSGGRHESVAEHSWRIALMAFWMKDAFPDADIDKVIRMCLIHDLGECFIGDIPTFAKTDADEAREEAELMAWVRSLPEPVSGEMEALYREMIALETPEAKLYKAIISRKSASISPETRSGRLRTHAISSASSRASSASVLANVGMSPMKHSPRS